MIDIPNDILVRAEEGPGCSHPKQSRAQGHCGKVRFARWGGGHGGHRGNSIREAEMWLCPSPLGQTVTKVLFDSKGSVCSNKKK